MTIQELVTREGSQEKAAHFLGVTLSTFRRWLQGKEISPMGKILLETKGVQVLQSIAPNGDK